jgi:hypothetical protein
MRLANRTKEVEFFKKMVRGETTKRILLIQATSGMGKTSLLAEFAALCPVHAEAALLVKIDLKSAQTGIAYIFSKLQRGLGEESFTRFDAALNKFLSAGVEVSDNQIEGTENQIQVVLNAESEEVRNFRLSKLQEAFFRDLSAIKKPVVMILDTFNLAPASVADWVGGSFLAAVAEVRNIRVVIAGQSVPKPTIEWEDIAETHCLMGISDIEAWHLFVEARGLPFEREAVKAFVRVFNGNPDLIAKVFESQSGGWKHE